MKQILRVTAWISLVVLCMPAPSFAQKWFGAATWDISFPLDDTEDFVSEESLRGFGLDFRNLRSSRTSIGLTLAWEVFHERTSESIELESLTITGSQDRYINSFPIMLGIHRYLGESGGTRPYIGINAGGFVLLQTLRIGLAEIEEDSWEWGVMPEAGIVWPLQSGAAFIVNARYSLALTGEDLAGNDSVLSYWGIRVGFAWERY